MSVFKWQCVCYSTVLHKIVTYLFFFHSALNKRQKNVTDIPLWIDCALKKYGSYWSCSSNFLKVCVSVQINRLFRAVCYTAFNFSASSSESTWNLVLHNIKTNRVKTNNRIVRTYDKWTPSLLLSKYGTAVTEMASSPCKCLLNGKEKIREQRRAINGTDSEKEFSRRTTSDFNVPYYIFACMWFIVFHASAAKNILKQCPTTQRNPETR
jgi:hypothetical protein